MVRSPYRRRRSSSSSSSGERGASKQNRSPRRDSHGEPRERRRSSKDRSRESSRRRSRSRESYRRSSRTRELDRKRSRSRESSRRRSRSRETGRKRGRSYSPIPERPIISNEPRYLNARIFVGHLPSDRCTKEELENHFKIYGKIIDSSVHPKGYGFVQFDREDDARLAVTKENTSLIKGAQVDVKMAAEGRRERMMVREKVPDNSSSHTPRDLERDFSQRDPLRDPYDIPQRPLPLRDRSPLRDPYDIQSRTLPPRERSPLRDPYDVPARPLLPRDISPLRDRYDAAGRVPPPLDQGSLRDPYNDRYRDPRDLVDPRDPVRLPRDTRDPYYNDPYRRLPSDPYYDRFDPYRRDPYADPYLDPYRDPYYAPPTKAPLPPPECFIILMNSKLRPYGENIERKIKALDILTEVLVIPDGKTLSQQIEDVARHKGMYAIVVNSENNRHQSLTLNILFGNAQEHRNMPLDCGIDLIKTTFEKHLASLKEKTAVPPAPAPLKTSATAPFTPPNKELSYLLHLVADKHHVTLEELDKIMMYLRDRRDEMVAAERQAAPVREAVRSVPAPYRPPEVSSPPANLALQQLQQQQQQQQRKPQLQTQDLQNNILGMLNGSNLQKPISDTSRGPPQSVPTLPNASPLSNLSPLVTPKSQGAPLAPVSASAINSALINLDNPNVQMALDNLIQSSPNLLRNITAATSTNNSSGATSTVSFTQSSSVPGVNSPCAPNLNLSPLVHRGSTPGKSPF